MVRLKQKHAESERNDPGSRLRRKFVLAVRGGGL